MYSSSNSVMYFLKEQYDQWFILFRSTLSLHRRRYKVSIIIYTRPLYLVHILYKHEYLDVDGSDSNENNREVIKEYHFYISDYHTHDTFFFIIFLIWFIKNYQYEGSLLKNIGCGQMVAMVSLNWHDNFLVVSPS